MKLTLTHIAIFVFIFLPFCSASKMLMIMPCGTKSHKIFYNGISQALAQQGHKVTFISPYKPMQVNPNIREVIILNNYFQDTIGNAFETSLMAMGDRMINIGIRNCVETMFEEPIQEILKENYDLVFMVHSFGDCYLAYIHEKKVPFVFMYPNQLYPQLYDITGNLYWPSVYPNIFIDVFYPMTFLQRVLNSLLFWTSEYFGEYILSKKFKEEWRRRNISTEDFPSIPDLLKKSSLTIVNSVRTLEIPARPYSQNVIFAGGIHIHSPEKLPKDIEDWVEGSGESGFILFSLGSSAKPSDMKEEHRLILLNVLGSLKQRVLWKWDQTEMSDLPSNVKLSKWLPQQSLLAHPKIRLFITHGGLLSTQESIYFGIPVVGMPIFLDQYFNINNVVSEGWGKRIDWQDLDENNARKSILEVLNDSSYQEIVASKSKLMKDVPMSPSDEVVYWVEYVLRHNGAKHLMTPLAHMPRYQLYNIDVWSFILSIILGVMYLLKCLVMFMLRCCCRRKQAQEQIKKLNQKKKK